MPAEDFTFLSTAIPQNEDGEYSYSLQSFLIPHEALRREFLRAERAIEGLQNVAKYPWKADYYRSWLIDFLGPSIHEHNVLILHVHISSSLRQV